MPTFHAQTKYWIEFKDKSISPQEFKPGNPVFNNTLKEFSPKALKRRSEAFGTSKTESLITIEDAPVSKTYLDSLRSFGIKAVTISNWANAVSAYLSKDQMKSLQKQTFILHVKPLALSKDNTKSAEEATSVFFPSTFGYQDEPEVLPIPAGYDTIINHYGLTGDQLRRMNIPPLHAMGFDGSGVILGYLDVGFRWRAMRTTKCIMSLPNMILFFMIRWQFQMILSTFRIRMGMAR